MCNLMITSKKHGYKHTQEYVGRFSDFKPDLSTKDIYNKITKYIWFNISEVGKTKCRAI